MTDLKIKTVSEMELSVHFPIGLQLRATFKIYNNTYTLSVLISFGFPPLENIKFNSNVYSVLLSSFESKINC